MKKIIIYAVLTTLILLAMLTGCSNKMDNSSSSLEKDTQNIVFKDNFDNYKLGKFPKKNWISTNRSPISNTFEKDPENQAFKIRGSGFYGEFIQAKNSLKNLDQYVSLEFDLHIPKTKNTSLRLIGTFGYLGADFSVGEYFNGFIIVDDSCDKKLKPLHFDTNYHVKINYNAYEQSYNLKVYNENNDLIHNLVSSEFVIDKSGEFYSALTYRCQNGEYSIDNVIIKAWQ